MLVCECVHTNTILSKRNTDYLFDSNTDYSFILTALCWFILSVQCWYVTVCMYNMYMCLCIYILCIYLKLCGHISITQSTVHTALTCLLIDFFYSPLQLSYVVQKYQHDYGKLLFNNILFIPCTDTVAALQVKS